MNEPIFALETTAEGSRRVFTDPWTARLGAAREDRPPPRPLPPLRTRLLASVGGIAGGALRLLPLRNRVTPS